MQQAARCPLESREQPSNDIEPAYTFILDFQSSRTVRNKFLLFINYPICDIMFEQQMDWKLRDFFFFLEELAKKYFVFHILYIFYIPKIPDSSFRSFIVL